MSTHLAGRVLDESTLLAMECRHILSLRTMQNPVPLSTLVTLAAEYDEDQVTPSAVALNRLHDQGVIQMVNFGRGDMVSLASAPDEAQGSTSRLVAGKGAGDSSIPAPRIYPAQERPSIMRSKEEVHLEFCSADCGRVASGHCDCGAPVCTAHRYGTDGHHDPKGMCGKCYDEAVMNGGVQ